MKLPTVYDLKPAFQGLLRPIVRGLVHAGITANQVTVGAALMSIAEGIWIYVDPTSVAALLCLPVVLFLRMALNAIDGMMAREHGQQSSLGGVLNELGDVVSDIALYLPFMVHPLMSPEWVLLFVGLAVLSEFTGVTLAATGKARRYDGPMGKSDRALFWGIVSFLAAVGVPLATWINWALGAACLLLVLTIFNRTRKGIG